jgi:hypothetical protein
MTMTSKLLRSALAVIALAGSLACGTVEAVLYNSHFDPIDVVSFEGNGRFYIRDDCLLLADDVYSGASCDARLEFADLTITVEDSPPDVGSMGQVHFGLSTDIVSIIIQGGELVGVNSGQIGPSFAHSCTGTGIVCDTPWWVQWNAPPPPPILTFDSLVLASVPGDSVTLFAGNCFSEERLLTPKATSDGCTPDDRPVGVAFDVTFTRIPEPGSLALLGAGLLAAFGVGRRRAGR